MKQVSYDTDTVTAVGFRINFGFNSAGIPGEHVAQLDRIAELLIQEPKLSLAVEGHTDAVGGDEFNLQLSGRRADAVVRYLVERGVDPKRLMSVGKGKREPLVADPYDGRNRRVQFIRIEPQTPA
jgi:outer membrane protein OmpA-like peptidoglycan-associated protein